MFTAQSPLCLHDVERHRALIMATLCLMVLCLLQSDTLMAKERVNNPLLGLSASQIAAVYGAQRTYSITRNGKQIGTHQISFQQQGPKVVVNVNSSITVRFLKIPVYRLAYVAEEVWLDDQLSSATATTTENGESNTVSMNSKDASNVFADTRFASNHWHPGVLTGKSVFNTLTGESSRITVLALGDEEVTTRNGVVVASHYEYQDDIRINVWYDKQGLWLKMIFSGEDGSAIQYLRDD